MNKDNIKRVGQALVAGSVLYGGLLASGAVARAMNTRILEANPGSTYVLDVDAQGKRESKPLTRAGLATSILRLADKAEVGGFKAEAKELNRLAGKILVGEESGK